MFLQIYNNLCSSRKLLVDQYHKGSELHQHHIIPKHNGGSDDADNLTFLTVREHIIAHYLLWKVYRQPNDLRAMHMLGAKLTSHQRKVTGEFCRDNKLGFHSATPAQRSKWSKKGLDTQKNNNSQNSFYYWSTQEGRTHRSSLGGLASFASGNNAEFKYWASPEGRKKRSEMGAAASAKKPATNGITTRKFKTDELRLEFLLQNPDWRIGVHWTKFKPSSET
ncbi:MAG: HNH endonuclease [Proteobacteria bacterium]|nr:HNH endonuclease [Pseudomonadota bacterium]